MTRITLNIQDSKYSAFLEFIKTLDYVQINENEQTPAFHKEIIENRLNELNEEDLNQWEDVKKKLNKKYGL